MPVCKFKKMHPIVLLNLLQGMSCQSHINQMGDFQI